MSAPCPVPQCQYDRPGNRQVCGGCESDLARALGDVPWLAAQLDITLARQGSHSGGGRSSEVPLPYDPRATEARFVLENTLVGWVKMLIDAKPERWPANSLPAIGVWLLARVERLAMHAAAEEAVDEICSAVRAAVRLVDRPAAYVYAGPCPSCEAGMFAKPGAAHVECRPCKARYDVAERREWMREQCESMLGSPSYVAMICAGLGVPVSQSTIRVWISRKKIMPRHFVRPITEDGKPRPLYLVGDVLRRASGQDDEVYSI